MYVLSEDYWITFSLTKSIGKPIVMAIKWSTDVLPCRPCSAKPVYSILTCRGTLPTYYFYELRRTSADSSSSKVVLSTHGKAADLRIALLCSVRNLREFFIRIILLLVLRF